MIEAVRCAVEAGIRGDTGSGGHVGTSSSSGGGDEAFGRGAASVVRSSVCVVEGGGWWLGGTEAKTRQKPAWPLPGRTEREPRRLGAFARSRPPNSRPVPIRTNHRPSLDPLRSLPFFDPRRGERHGQRPSRPRRCVARRHAWRTCRQPGREPYQHAPPGETGRKHEGSAGRPKEEKEEEGGGFSSLRTLDGFNDRTLRLAVDRASPCTSLSRRSLSRTPRSSRRTACSHRPAFRRAAPG